MRKLSYAIAGAAALALCSAPVWAQSSKAAFTFNDINILEALTFDIAIASGIEDTNLSAGVGTHDGDGDCESLRLASPFDHLNDFGEDELDNGACVLNPATLAKHFSILKTDLKVPKHKDISIDVSLECGNFLNTGVKSKGGKTDSAFAEATVRVAVMVDDGVNTRFALPMGNAGRDLDFDGNPDGVLTDGVVFCHRSQELEAKFQGIFTIDDETTDLFIITVDGETGDGSDDVGEVFETLAECELFGTEEGDENTCVEKTFVATCLFIDPVTGRIVADLDCFEPEEVKLITGSMTANSFNFMYENANESGVHTIEVLAWVDLGTNLGGTAKGNATAKAAVGLGSAFAETVRLINSLDAGDLESDPPTLQ